MPTDPSQLIALDYATEKKRRVTPRRVVISLLLASLALLATLAWNKLSPRWNAYQREREEQSYLLKVPATYRASWTEAGYKEIEGLGSIFQFTIQLDKPRPIGSLGPTIDASVSARSNSLSWIFQTTLWAGVLRVPFGDELIALVRANSVRVGTFDGPTLCVYLQRPASLLRSENEQPAQVVAIGLEPPFELSHPRVDPGSQNRLLFDLTTPTQKGIFVVLIDNAGKATAYTDFRPAATQP